MKQFQYSADLTNLTVFKTDKEQHDEFFYKGHPQFLIPDFEPECPLQDIYTSYCAYLDRKSSCEDGECYDDGGEITSHNVIDTQTGLTKCVYEAYGVMLSDDDEPIDISVEIEGYVVCKNEDEGTYFIATKVIEHS